MLLKWITFIPLNSESFGFLGESANMSRKGSKKQDPSADEFFSQTFFFWVCTVYSCDTGPWVTNVSFLGGSTGSCEPRRQEAVWVSDNHIEWTMPQIGVGKLTRFASFDREGLQELAVNTHSRYGVNNKTKQPDKKHRHPTSIYFSFFFFSVGIMEKAQRHGI